MERLLRKLKEMPEIAELVRRIEDGGCPAGLTGVQSVQRACAGAAAAAAAGRSAVFICGDEAEARTLEADLRALTGRDPVVLPRREWQLRPGAVASREWEQRRISAFAAMADGSGAPIIATVDALMARTMPKEVLREMTFRLETGGRTEPSEFARQLVRAGYVRCDQVEGPGQFAVRGGILDVFSARSEQPVRCEFFGDEIDSMGYFDPSTQRRTENADTCTILPASEVLLHCAEGGLDGLADTLEKLADRVGRRGKTEDTAAFLRESAERARSGSLPEAADRYLAAVWPDFTSGLDHLPKDAVIFLCEDGRVEERARTAAMENRQDLETLLDAGVIAGEYARLLLSPEELYAELGEFPAVMMNALPASRHPLAPKALLNVNARQLSSYGGSLEAAVSDLAAYRVGGSAVLVLCGSETRAGNLRNMLEERGIPAVLDTGLREMPAPGEVRVSVGALSAGCEWPALHLAVLSEGQIISRRQKKLRLRSDANRQRLQSYTDLDPGDLVVHVHHGIGRFAGIRRMPVDGVEKDYIRIDYAGGDCLYVPVTQLDLVSKYIGGGESDGAERRLSRLGGTEWAKQKVRARKAAQDLAKGLIRLYAERQRMPGFAFSPDSPWQKEFEEAFPYEETEDQLRSTEEIKRDMEQPRPMDRLLCGDVGYGKTEVALRAVMKCILDGKQAAILVPTTVLAQQHYTTAAARFRDFPVRIESLSRFTPPKEAKRILEAARTGGVDLLIGTHRLLQKTVQFKDLGLLIVDEEQRFGVTHKERLKEMSRQVDVLTLTATPIPRTLNMALTGLRDMSIIEEPPADRQPVQTYVMEHDWAIIEDAIRRELARGGQVYYIHNRIETIDLTAARLRQILGPEVRIAVGHGQMDEKGLSEVMRSMVEGETDVLVCTTIIETGIDIPNVNTLIIEDADRMGLAQLHQIRGRTGRSARRAYAYLTYRRGKILQETAVKRLAAIREYVEFGSGFRIAMRDLEIRGAGNLLGPEQSGYLATVGYDLFMEMISEASLEERGVKRSVRAECSADLTVNANIPERYVPSPEERIDLYRRIAAIRDPESASDLLDELLDRYGETPKSVLALLDVAMLRTAAAKEGVSEITQRGDLLRFRFETFSPEAVAKICSQAKYRRRLTVSAGARPELRLQVPRDADVLETARGLVEDLRLATPPKSAPEE